MPIPCPLACMLSHWRMRVCRTATMAALTAAVAWYVPTAKLARPRCSSCPPSPICTNSSCSTYELPQMVVWQGCCPRQPESENSVMGGQVRLRGSTDASGLRQLCCCGTEKECCTQSSSSFCSVQNCTAIYLGAITFAASLCSLSVMAVWMTRYLQLRQAARTVPVELHVGESAPGAACTGRCPHANSPSTSAAPRQSWQTPCGSSMRACQSSLCPVCSTSASPTAHEAAAGAGL